MPSKKKNATKSSAILPAVPRQTALDWMKPWHFFVEEIRFNILGICNIDYCIIQE
jgi:hypothetical protein